MNAVIELNLEVVKAGTSKTSGRAYGEFLRAHGVIRGGTQSVEFTLNNTEAAPTLVEDLKTVMAVAAEKARTIAPSAPGKGVSLIPVVECELEIGAPVMVPATGTEPARQKTWAGKPLFGTKGNVTLRKVVEFAKFEYDRPVTLVADDFMSSAVDALR